METNKPNAVRRYRLSEDEEKVLLEYRGIKDASDSINVDDRDVKHGWIKTQTASLFFKNPNYEASEFDPDSIDWKTIFKRLDLNIPKIRMEVKEEGIFDRFVYTDTHIAMEPNPDGYSLYGGKWDEEEVMGRLSSIVEHIVKHRRSKVLVIDDLGDLADGFDGKTVRRQHDLPQNMDNQKTFDVALSFKYNLFLELSPYYEEIIFNNICRSNHSAAFDYIINSAFKALIEVNDTNAKVTNYRKFINHYQIKDNIFIITHGKDDIHLKTGFKPHLTRENTEKIDNYIDQNYLLKKDCRIEFSKGDSHQWLFDGASSDRFDYFNYPALSPSSDWVQTNFKKGTSGCMFFSYTNTFEYKIEPLFFKWKDKQ